MDGPAPSERRDAAYWTVETKLMPPVNRPGTVPRAPLVDRLLATDRPVVALVAVTSRSEAIERVEEIALLGR